MNKCCSALPVAIIGGGPVGLAAAAHLLSKGESFILFEASNEIAGNIQRWSHVRLFSPWQFNIDKAAKLLLEESGWKTPILTDIPTGGELVEQYLAPLSNLPIMNPHIHVYAKVTAVSRKGLSKVKTAGRVQLPFLLHVTENGERKAFEAKAVIDASGTWATPNPAVSNGIWTENELALKDQIIYGIPDVVGQQRERYAGKHVLVVGSGHSAINALLDLEKLKEQEPDTTISWIIRKSQVNEVYGGQEKDSLRVRGELGIRLENLVRSSKVHVYPSFMIENFEKSRGQIHVVGYSNGQIIQIDSIDEVISNTGSRPDMSFLREVRTDIDSAIESVGAIAPLIDPNLHSCGTVRPHGEKELRQPEQNFYIVGSKSYGRAPTFLMTTGYEQVRSIVAALTGDWEAAEKVELELPETGVCNLSLSREESCCETEESDREKPIESTCCTVNPNESKNQSSSCC
ncbi:NAD(P)-binding domain-containing protein [Paenibacillus arenosi]|uniref:NAD(P)-binding domain-containing protein n=1 Tax=Paenibacillus arenosi TaxID=2774142 RepID=A0ABR9AYW4_9BACL|nr:NAD(P)-binding domain-containing protein [Paenibacillus arenosi]MBD8499212.1 NAD(P)-binding domain-containing protein [Paenibacillus arenosi]